jgi:hypothetical protein
MTCWLYNFLVRVIVNNRSEARPPYGPHLSLIIPPIAKPVFPAEGPSQGRGLCLLRFITLPKLLETCSAVRVIPRFGAPHDQSTSPPPSWFYVAS